MSQCILSSVYLCIYLSSCVSIHLIYVFIHLSIHLSTYTSNYHWIYTSIYCSIFTPLLSYTVSCFAASMCTSNCIQCGSHGSVSLSSLLPFLGHAPCSLAGFDVTSCSWKLVILESFSMTCERPLVLWLLLGPLLVVNCGELCWSADWTSKGLFINGYMLSYWLCFTFFPLTITE